METIGPYYFSFDTRSDGSLIGHSVRIESHHFPPNADRTKLTLLGADRSKDKRIEQLLHHGFENYPPKEPRTDESRVKDLRGELDRLTRLLGEFPLEHLTAALSDNKSRELIDMMMEQRRKSAGIFREVADDFERAGKVLDTLRHDIRSLQSLSNNLDMLKEFTDTIERLAAVEKSGFLASIKPLLQ